MNISNESKVGILAAVGIALLYIGINYLKGINVFNRGDSYYVEYAYSGGISEGDPVNIDGYAIGRVKGVTLQEDHSGVNIAINITEDVTIPDDSYAMIRGDFLGSKYIDLKLGQSTVIVEEGGKINGSIEAELTNQIREELKPLTDKVKSMVVSLDTAITVLRGIFTDDVVSDFQTSMSSIKKTLESFNKSADRVNEMIISEQYKIDEIITDVNSITNYVNESGGDVKTTIANLKAVSESLKQIDWPALSAEIQEAVTQINEISAKIDSGDGSLSMLINDPALYNDLVNTLNSLKKVINDFGEDPELRVILFGKKNKESENAPIE